MKVSKFSFWVALALAVLPLGAFADTCSNYADLIRRKTSDYLSAMSHTTDQMERQILTDAFEAAVDGLKMEMAALGCSTDALPLPPAAPPVNEEPGEDPAEDPTLPPDVPGDDGTDDPTLPPDVPGDDGDQGSLPDDPPAGDDDDDGGLPPDEDDGDNTPLPDNLPCADQLDAYAELLRSQGVRQNEFVRLMKKKIHETGCGKNYGGWRSHYAKKCHKKAELKKKCDLRKKAACKPKPKKCGKR